MGLRLLAVACLVGAAFAGPFQRESQCATRCPSSTVEKYNYEPGRKYVYDYQGVNYVVVAGERRQKSQINGQVEIHVKSKCEFVLKLKNIRLEQKATPEETASLIRKLEIPLPFAFEDGKINHTCPSSEDTQQSLNIKKGVLSTFVNSMDELERSQEVKEVDSLGTCQTKYTVLSRSVVEKQKDLKSCTNRHSAITSLMSSQYESPQSDIHTLPVFPQEKFTCRQEIERKVMNSIKCKELSAIRPLQHRDSLIELEGQVELQLIKVETAENMRFHTITIKDPILYDLQEEMTVEDVEGEVREHLRKICSKNIGTIDISVSKDFIELVSAVKHMSYESLQRIYSSLENKRLCSSKKLTDLFLDTLPMAGNDAAIKLMVNLLVGQKVTGMKAKMWTASLALVSHPSQEAITAVVPLIKRQKTASVLLGVSAMVYRHCSQKECENNPDVREIVSSLNEVLGRRCSFNSEKEAVAVLKAFGNMGQLLQAEENILACAQNRDNSIRVRLAAIDSFRRVNKKRPEMLVRLYTDTQEHYEVRIAALSSVLRKADRRQILSIKQVAEHESDEQVSAYTGTLISNMNKTSSPLNKNLRHILRGIEVQAPNVSYWVNSKNIELSTFSETFNVGSAVEADIIHSPHSKIPRSTYARLDFDVFDKHVNIFEVGMRAVGIEESFKKLIGFKDGNKQKSWNFLRASNDIEDKKIEGSLFFRTMNTELFDLSVDDFTGMGEMIKIADILNKISHDKSADFSQSFMFMNSKLVIPSVTGRSYSFGLTGSATVGLTASSKVDIVNIMSKPSNCDVHGHFQPSVNVEFSATVGMHSKKPRPDLKIVTRFHSESDIQAYFRVQDGRLGLVKVDLPSENIVLSRISSDIIEIDTQHQERRVYEQMQTKIDYCFNKLEKPLGLSICGKWEVPQPFLSKTFPFVKGVGSIEMSIKKSDLQMRGYELSFEIPKHKSQTMKYKASMDTPGSRINRRFSADLEVRMPSEEQKQFSLSLQSPFRSGNASASGSLTMRRDLIESSLDVLVGFSKHYSAKASSNIYKSGSQKIYQSSIQISSPSSTPLKVDGKVTVTKGKKEQISFDLKSNKPSQEPLMLKGTVVKDGRLSFSKNAEWKISTDLALKTPMANMHIRSSTEKQEKQSQTISTSFSVDYQRGRRQKQSVKLSAKLQKSSSKLSSFAQMETTEYPSTNFALTWNMQGKMRESLKNDITLKYGRNPERQYINILHSSNIYPQPGECRIAIKAPQFNIDSELSVTHDIQKNSRIHVGVDFRYKEDKRIKAKLHLDRLSQRPMKLRVNAELQAPGKKIMYQDELEQTDQNSYKGNAVLEWNEDKRTELQYKYQKLSDQLKFHHKFETTLRLPSSRSPIKSKSSFQMSRENVGFEGRLSLNRNSEYSITVHLNKKSASHLSLKMPKMEGNLKVVNDKDKKAADLDVKLNLSRRSRHVIASATLGLGSQKKLEAKISLDADRRPEQKFLVSYTFEKQSRDQYTSSSKLQISDKANIECSSSGDLALYGVHEATIQARILRYKPVGVVIKHELRQAMINSVITISKDQKQKVELRFEGEYVPNRREKKLSTSVSLKSLDNSFQTKKVSSEQYFSRSGSSVSLKSNARLEWSSSKIYVSEIGFDSQQNMVLLKAKLNTPHLNFEKQAVEFSFRKSGALLVSAATIDFAKGKFISVTSETQQKSQGFHSSLAIRSPFDIIKDAKIELEWENRRSQKSFKSSVDVNGAEQAITELNYISSSRLTEVKGRVKVARQPEVKAHMTVEKNGESFKYDMQVMRDSSLLMSTIVSKQVSNKEYSYTLQSKSQDKTLFNLQFQKESSSQRTKHLLVAEGPFPQLSAYLEASPNDKNSVIVGIKACELSQRSLCYSLKAYHKVLMPDDVYRYHKTLSFDLEKSLGNSQPEHLASVNIIASIKENDYRGKFIFEMKEKKLGYDFRIHRRENDHDHCSFDSSIFMSHRTLRAHGSGFHSEKTTVLDFEIVPDSSVPTRKFVFEVKKEKDNKEVSGYARMLFPGMKNAIQLSGHIQKEGFLPVGGKAKLDYSSVGGKVLIFDILSEQQGRSQTGRKYIQYKLYSEDKEIDISAKLSMEMTQEISDYRCEWDWQTHQQGRKEGQVSMKLSRGRDGKPKYAEVEFKTPSRSSKLNSHITWGSRVPSGLRLAFESDNEKLAEIDVQVEGNCLIVEETLKSRQFMKNQVCVSKVEGDKLKLISIQSYYQRQRSLDFEIEVDRQHPHIADIILKWDRSSFSLAMHEARQMLSELRSRYISNADFESFQKMYRQVMDSLTHPFRDMREQLLQNFNHHCHTIQTKLIKAKHISSSAIWKYLSRFIPIHFIRDVIIEPINAISKCLFEKYTEFVHNYLLDVCRALWKTTKRELIECLRDYCPRDSLCYEVSTLLEDFELEKAKMLASSRIAILKRTVSETFEFYHIHEWIERPVSAVRRLLEAVCEKFLEGQLVGIFLDLALKTENMISERLKHGFELLVEWALQVLKHAERDEDFRVLKSLVLESKEKAISAWEKAESLLQSEWAPLRESFIEEYPRKWVDERMTIVKFSPKEGNIQIQIHHPFQNRSMQVLKNAFFAVREKVRR